MSWQSYYQNIGNRFGVMGPDYGPAGHHGQDFPNPAGTPTPAYESGVIALVEFSTYLGTVISVKMKDGLYAGYAHQQRNPPVKVGQSVTAGQTIGLTAGASDSPGTSWHGSHLHTTLGPTATSVFGIATIDPLPRVKRNTGGNDPGTGGKGNMPPTTNVGFDPLGVAAAGKSISDVVTFFTNGSNWVRIGTMALGVSLLAIALIKILSETSAGQAAISTTKTALKTAATVATVA
jgi:hypothetical protein